MNPENSRKIKLLKIWEILNQETDENHPMGTVALIEKLKKAGIEVDRKILYTDIDLLNANGYEIQCTRGRSNLYYVVDRSFDVAEIRILVDAVQSASFISEKRTSVLVDKIVQLAGSRRGEILKSHTTTLKTIKTLNEKVLYSVDAIENAKDNGNKIGFYYFDYDINREKQYRMNGDSKKWYEVNPIATVLDNDQYYLICYHDKYKDPTHYRIDRMDEVKELDIKNTRLKDASKIDLDKYKRQLFGMYAGETKRITFIAEPSMADVIFDKLGNQVSVRVDKNGNLICTAEVQIGPMLIAWLCSFGQKLKVQAPLSLIKKVKEHLESTLAQYE